MSDKHKMILTPLGEVKLSDISLGTNYSRTFGNGDISELTESMRDLGQLTPVTLDPDNKLIAGFRRIAAAEALGWETLNACRCEADPRIVNLIENINRKDLSLWEEVQGLRDAFGPEASYAEIGRAMSKTTSWVKPRVDVWTLPPEEIQKVKSGFTKIGGLKRALNNQRGPSAVSKNMGFPSQLDIKRMVSQLMVDGREIEARALSFACGSVTEDDLMNSTDFS